MGGAVAVTEMEGTVVNVCCGWLGSFCYKLCAGCSALTNAVRPFPPPLFSLDCESARH